MRETFSEFWENLEQEELRSACARGWAERVWNAALASATQPEQGEREAHPDDLAVDRFAVVMKQKLAAARAKGRAAGMIRPPTPDVQGLAEALEAALMVTTSQEVRLEKQAVAIAGVRRCFARRHEGRYAFMPYEDAVRHCRKWIAALRDMRMENENRRV